MDLEEGDDSGAGGGEGVVFPQLFYDKEGNEVDARREDGETQTDPLKRFMDRPGAVPPNHFDKGIDLDR